MWHLNSFSVTRVKECAYELAPLFATVFNLSLYLGILQEDWKRANVSAIFKKGTHYNPANYRPKSLTCLCCKLLEPIIISNVISHVNYHTLTDNQYRRWVTGGTQLITITQELASSLDNVILGFSKTFDRVPHKRLLKKLSRYGVSR